MPTLLDHNRSLRAEFLHANGENGTEVLINKLNIKGNENVLELGTGTGATLIKLKSKFPTITLKGIDSSNQMIEMASKRISFCGLKNKIEILHTSQKQLIQDHSIDIVYIESVLGILDSKTLRETLTFLSTILKEKGKLVINESIWLDSISEKQIETINKKCIDTFGIIQCNLDFNTLNTTLELFKSFGFNNISFERIRNTDAKIKSLKTITDLRSKIFSLLGKFKLMYSLKLKSQEKKYNAEMTTIFEEEKEYLTGVIMAFQKD